MSSLGDPWRLTISSPFRSDVVHYFSEKPDAHNWAESLSVNGWSEFQKWKDKTPEWGQGALSFEINQDFEKPGWSVHAKIRGIEVLRVIAEKV